MQDCTEYTESYSHKNDHELNEIYRTILYDLTGLYKTMQCRSFNAFTQLLKSFLVVPFSNFSKT